MNEFKSQAEVWQALLDGKTLKRIDRKYRFYNGVLQHSDIDLNNWDELWSLFDPFIDFSTYTEPKRRFKTAEELVANQYGIVSFNAYGVVEVMQSGATLRRTQSDTPEGNYSKEWLDVFTCFCSDDVKD
jgi:hypothetical protein